MRAAHLLLLAALAPLGTPIAARQAPRPILAVRDADPGRAGPLAHEAFRAAFGRDREAPLTRAGFTYDFVPVTAVELGGGRVALVSTGVKRDAGHSEPGLNAVHYLVRENRRLRVVGRWFGLGVDGSMGASAMRWGVTRSLSRWPVLYTEGGGTWQGCTVSFATLTELRRTGPVDVATIPIGFSNAGIIEGPEADTVAGAIAGAVPDRSFTVRYRGTMRFSETYVRAGNAYRLASGRESQLQGC